MHFSLWDAWFNYPTMWLISMLCKTNTSPGSDHTGKPKGYLGTSSLLKDSLCKSLLHYALIYPGMHASSQNTDVIWELLGQLWYEAGAAWISYPWGATNNHTISPVVVICWPCDSDTSPQWSQTPGPGINLQPNVTCNKRISWFVCVCVY